MSTIDLSGPLALVGGVSGAAILAYSVFNILSARKKERMLQEMRQEQQVGFAFMIGFMMGGKK